MLHQDMRTEIWHSYGATCTILSFLSQIEATELQRLNRFMYKTGLPRAQTRVRLEPMTLLTTYCSHHGEQELVRVNQSTMTLHPIHSFGSDLVATLPVRGKLYCFLLKSRDESRLIRLALQDLESVR